MADLRIVPITPVRLDDLDTLFASGDPRTCQCAYLRLTHSDYAHTSPAEHRDVHHRAVRRAARAKRTAGLLAYDDAGPAGWVSFGPRDEFARIVASPVLQPVDDAEVTSVVCFVIAPRARRRGVATALLESVIGFATEHDIPLLEAYPIDRDGRAPGAELWRGPRRLYEAAGFSVAATRQANATARRQLIMRRAVP
jgi:GNAT superfamily N-acetyltransferase